MKIGVIFPGQGSQYLGMGKEFYDKERIAQDLFEQASGCLGINFVKLCFASSEKELRDTVNAQTAIFLLSSSIYDILNKKYEIQPTILAGHSCGEYSAVYAARGMSFSDSIYLLKKRAEFMQKATSKHQGGMLAVVGAKLEDLEFICNKYDDPEKGLLNVVEVVNINSPSQFVISGTLEALEKVKEDLNNLRIKTISLNVAGAFHSRLMQEPEKEFLKYMVKIDFKDLSCPIVSNIGAKLISDSQDVKDALSKQMSGPVLWWKSMQKFKDLDLIIQVGPGNTLSKMLKREWPEKDIFAVNKFEDLQDLLTSLDKKLKIDNLDGE